MLDPQPLRGDIDSVARRLAARPFTLDVAAFQTIEDKRKAVQTRTQDLQSSRNQLAKRIGQAKAKGEDVAPLMAESARANSELNELEKRLESIQQQIQDFVLGVPNIPHESVPAGKSPDDNGEVRRNGTPRPADFTVKDHVDIGA